MPTRTQTSKQHYLFMPSEVEALIEESTVGHTGTRANNSLTLREMKPTGVNQIRLETLFNKRVSGLSIAERMDDFKVRR